MKILCVDDERMSDVIKNGQCQYVVADATALQPIVLIPFHSYETGFIHQTKSKPEKNWLPKPFWK